MKLFFPYPCGRNILEVLIESFDFYIFYDQMTLQEDERKYMIFATQSLISIIIEFPQIL